MMLTWFGNWTCSSSPVGGACTFSLTTELSNGIVNRIAHYEIEHNLLENKSSVCFFQNLCSTPKPRNLDERNTGENLGKNIAKTCQRDGCTSPHNLSLSSNWRKQTRTKCTPTHKHTYKYMPVEKDTLANSVY